MKTTTDLLKTLLRLVGAFMVGSLIALFLMGAARSAGKLLMMEDNSNPIEVATAFLSGAIIALIYRDRLYDKDKGKDGDHGR